VWYSLAIATAGVYTIDVTDPAPAQADFVLTLHDVCGGALLACNDFDWSSNIPRMRRYLTPGAYLVRVAGNRGFSGRASEGTFTLSVSTAAAQLANDECAAATAITPASSTSGTSVDATPAAAGAITSSCSTQDRIDVWYALSIASTAQYAITLSPTGGWDATLSVWEGCGGSQIACGNGTQRLFLSSGSTYLLRVSGTLDATGAFTLDVDGGTPIPPNDLCANPGVVSVGSVTATNAAASGSDETPDCAYNDVGDVWFSFVPAINGFYTFDTAGSTGLTDTSIALFDTCGGPVLVCNDDIAPNAGTSDRLSRVGRTLTAGAPVLVRVAGTNGEAGAFTLNVSGPGTAPTVPSNDSCENAAPVTGTSFVASVDARAATSDQPTDCIFGGLAQTSYGVWYRFVAPEHGVLTFTENGTIATSVVSFFEDCPVAIPAFPLQCGQITFELDAGDSRLFLVGVQGVEYPNGPYLVSATWTPQLGCCQTTSACTVTAHSACTGTWTDGLCGPSVAAVGGTNLPITIMNPTTNGQPIYKDSAVTVTDTGTVSNLTVSVHLVHSSAPHVVLRLTTPWGATVQILNGTSGGSSYNGDYTFSDLGIQTISSLADQSPLPSRVYLPNNPIGSAVSGHSAAGVWTLSVGDDTRSGSQGTLSSWSLDIHTACTVACRADFNGNSTLEVQDIFDYLNAWFAGNPSADFNGGGLAVQDIFDFLNAWFAGC
jgi:subtilisin-like proprotein convertase family protein